MEEFRLRLSKKNKVFQWWCYEVFPVQQCFFTYLEASLLSAWPCFLHICLLFVVPASSHVSLDLFFLLRFGPG